MKRIKTVVVQFGFTLSGSLEKFDNTVNQAIEEIDGEVIDIKYSFENKTVTAMIVYEKK